MAASFEDEELYYQLLEKSTNKIPQDKLMKPNWIKIMIERIESAKKVIKNDSYDNLHPKVKDTLKKYCVREVTVPGNPDTKQKKLFMKKEDSAKPWQVIPLTETFQIVNFAHISTNHGGVDKMAASLSNSHLAVPSICLTTILDICKVCQKQAKNQKKTVNQGSEPIKTENYKMYIDSGLIDIKNMSMYGTNGKLDHLLIYQDMNTKFLQLRPVSSTDLVESTSKELVQIFSDMGPPKFILVSSVFKDLLTRVLEWLDQIFSSEIKLLLKDQLVGPMKYYNVSSKIESAINDWLSRDTENLWSIGCFIVQWELNNEQDVDGKSPFEKISGSEKNNSNSEDTQILKSIEGLSINRSNKKRIDNFILEAPVLEVPIEYESA